MPSLAEVQRALARAIVAQDDAALSAIVTPRMTARAAIHRRHFRLSLTRALESTFPAVVSLVDERFFAYCADAFIRETPPANPRLHQYGAHFAQFLTAFPPCEGLRYIGDVARLEWTINAAFHELGRDLSPGSMFLTPALRLFRSRYPIDRIWKAALGRAEGPVDLAAGSARLVVYQDEDEVSFAAPTPAGFVFLIALAARRPLAAALERAWAIDPNFRTADIPPMVARGVPQLHATP